MGIYICKYCRQTSLNSIQLALLCEVNTIRECGYSEVLRPFLQDLVLLKKHGVYVAKMGSNVRGTILYVAAGNLAAHSLAGYQKNFVSDKICRICMAILQEIQDTEVRSGHFNLRTKQDHDQHIVVVQQNTQVAKQYSVKRSCPLSDYLEYFHVIDGFPQTSSMIYLKVLFLLSYAFALNTLSKRSFSHLTC